MPRSVGLVVTACIVGAISVPCRGGEAPASILKYLGERAAKRAAPWPLVSGAPGDWKWLRSELAKSIPESLGLPPREPMKAAVTYQKHDGELVIEEVIYHWAGGTYAAAHVIRRKEGTERRAAVVVCPGHLAHYTWRGYREFVNRTARAGLVVLFIEDPRIGKRHAAEAGLYAVGAAAGTPILGVQVFDALRGLDYLVTRPDVDPGRIGVAGFGPGVPQALLAATVESRFRFALLGKGKRLYGLADAASAIPEPPGYAEPDMAACLPQIEPLVSRQITSLPASSDPPAACGKPENPNFSMIKHFQGQIAAHAATFAKALASQADWQSYHREIVRWLEDACGLKRMQPGAAKVMGKSAADGLSVERIDLAIDAALTCPAVLTRRARSGGGKQAAVIFSHDSPHAAEAPEVQAIVRRLASQGYWVFVPEHVSTHSNSPRRVELADLPGFFAAADRAGLAPLGLRVAENLAAFRYLAGRQEIDPARVVIGGSGIGAIDACLAAALEPRIAGVAPVNVTTFRDWARNVAPEEVSFVHVMPYLPGMLAVADLDYFIAAIAPRPLVLARLKAGWPKSGFDQAVATAAAVYRLTGDQKALTALGRRDPIEERIAHSPEGVPKQVLAVAQAILPPPPIPGVVGTREGLRSRDTVDSASGIVWIVGPVGGEEQEFCDGGYHLQTWSFFNDNGAAERGRAITPLVFKREGDLYKLAGIGKTRINAGTGLQTFPFEASQGSDRVGAGYLFGFYTGDPAGKPNAGVVEYNDDPQHQMIILTLDGGLGDQKVLLGQAYREQSRWPRAYSIQAVSQRK